MRGVDVSVYSGTISVEQWRKIRQDGYELAVVGLFHGRTANGFAGQQLSGAIEAGLEVAAYILVAPWMGWTGPQQVAAGMAQAQVYKDKLRFVAVDVEIDGVTETMIRDALSTVKELGQRPIIYTGRWWWVYHFGDSQLFKDYPLWAAQYPFFLTDEPENLLGWVTLYGGWAREGLVGWQYTNSTQLHGVNVCKDWFDSEWVMKGEEMRPPLYRFGDTPHVYFLAGGKLFHIPNQRTFLALGFKPEDVNDVDNGSCLASLPVEYPGGVPGELRASPR